MPLPRLFLQIRSFFAKAKSVLGKCANRLANGAALLLGSKASNKKRYYLIMAAGVLAILLLVFTGIALLAKGAPAEQQLPSNQDYPQAMDNTPQRGSIPPEDLFLPDEPDFVPGVLLERERRAKWAIEDAEPWWQDPLKEGEEPWRDRIENTIDRLMENVP